MFATHSGTQPPGKRWVILFCDAQAKRCPVSEFIAECPVPHQVKVFHILELLEEMGPTLPRPYADLLQDGVHELRVKLSGTPTRLLYFFCYERYIVFYAVLRKFGGRVPPRYIEATRKYREDFLRRIERHDLEASGHGRV